MLLLVTMPQIIKKAKLGTKVVIMLIASISLNGCSVIGTNKPAALQITTTPEASVFLDGKHLGKTPFSSEQLKAGTYTLKISGSDASYLDKITLNAGTLTVVNRDLSANYLAQAGELIWLESGKKGLFVASQPQDADLIVDGKIIGKTPISLEDLEEGVHRIVLTKAGFVERDVAIKTSKKFMLNANVTLASELAKNGKLQAASASAQLKVKKVEVGKTPQGFLRVRKEPSLNSQEVGRVNVGDQLEVIQETKDWTLVKFEGKQGWISNQFTKAVEN